MVDEVVSKTTAIIRIRVRVPSCAPAGTPQHYFGSHFNLLNKSQICRVSLMGKQSSFADYDEFDSRHTAIYDSDSIMELQSVVDWKIPVRFW